MKKKKQKIKKLVHARVDVWLDSLGDANEVDDVCFIFDHALRMCEVLLEMLEMLAIQQKKEKKSDER